MNDIETLNKMSRIATIIIVLSAILFCVNILPLLYTNGVSFLAGSGGTPPINSEENELILVNSSLAYISGIVGAVSVLLNTIISIRRAKIEARADEMKLKAIELQYEMQMREIDKLKLELEQEKHEKKNKKK